MNCFASFINFILYILNVVFLIVGILLIVLGSIMLSNINGVHGFEEVVSTNVIPIMITVLGALIFVVSFFGCCGAWRQSACLTGTYAVFMFILFVLQLALTIWVFVHRHDFLVSMGKAVTTAWKENTSANDYPMSALELTFKCCGDNSYADYLSIGQTVPGSCCGYANRQQSCSAAIYENRQGCNDKFVDFWQDNTDIIRWAGIGICIFELIVFAVACCLAGSMRNSAMNSA